jgi:hypothetical protein
MQETSDVLGALNWSGGRWAVALAATAAFMVGGGYLGSVATAQAGGEPGNDDVGSGGWDGLSVTCYAYNPFLRDDALVCNVVGEGEGGGPGVVYRLVATPAAPDHTK